METVLSQAYCQIWDNSFLGVLIIDKEGIIRYMNRLLILTDDLQGEEILGKRMVDFYPLERDCHMSIQTAKTGKPIINKTIVYYTHKRKLVNSLSSTFPLISNHGVEGVIHFSLNLQTSEKLLKSSASRAILLHESGEPAKDCPEQSADDKGTGTPKTYTFRSLIGEEMQFKNAITYAKSAARTDFSVFIWAESGCGKELFAQAIHADSARRKKPFVPINCAAIPDNLLETTLFGTAKGAFTGAMEKPGLLEEAEGGTLLLDELNSMSLELQAKLLRAIQEKRIRRVGALQEVPVDVKFIATCNIPPSRALDENKIRTDLFYRLAVVVLEIPPLRNRTSDIPLLCDHFLERWRDRFAPLSIASMPSPSSSSSPQSISTISVSDAVYELFTTYPWPGNVRELEHTLKSTLPLLQGGHTIEPAHLSDYFMNNYRRLTKSESYRHTLDNQTGSFRDHFMNPPDGSLHPIKHQDVEPTPLGWKGGAPLNLTLFSDFELPLNSQNREKICLNSTLKNIETLYIERALKKAGYNISKAGRFLNLSPQALRYKVKRLGIHIPVE